MGPAVDWASNTAKFKNGSRIEFRDPFLRYAVSARQLRNPLRPRRVFPQLIHVSRVQTRRRCRGGAPARGGACPEDRQTASQYCRRTKRFIHEEPDTELRLERTRAEYGAPSSSRRFDACGSDSKCSAWSSFPPHSRR